ncbi:MFS transporter [Streptomyces sp. NPDC053792]|uniref:MFS transporter n=1 Tax=Streptomyces sp. NPDC053792 TaxID=3365716 RepID=UPI0037D2FEF1
MGLAPNSSRNQREKDDAQLFVARGLLGVGEAGYAPAGGALVSSYFPQRLRATVLSLVMAAGPLGSVLGVVVGGAMAERWGWRVTLGAFGAPGLLLALLFLVVRDYCMPAAADRSEAAPAASAPAAPLGLRATFGELFRSRTAAWCYLGGALNLIVLSALYSWLPSYLGRAYGLSAAESGAKAARVNLAGIVGAVAFGNLADRCGRTRPRRRLMVPAVAAVVTCGLLTAGMDSDRRAA